MWPGGMWGVPGDEAGAGEFSAKSGAQINSIHAMRKACGLLFGRGPLVQFAGIDAGIDASQQIDFPPCTRGKKT